MKSRGGLGKSGGGDQPTFQVDGWTGGKDQKSTQGNYTEKHRPVCPKKSDYGYKRTTYGGARTDLGKGKQMH